MLCFYSELRWVDSLGSRGDLDHRNSPHHTFVAMYFVFLEFFLYLIAAFNLTFAWKVKVDRQLNGIDHFELLGDDKKSICTTTEKAMEFCAKHGAVMVRNTRICLDDQQSLYCRCNSTKSTFFTARRKLCCWRKCSAISPDWTFSR